MELIEKFEKNEKRVEESAYELKEIDIAEKVKVLSRAYGQGLRDMADILTAVSTMDNRDNHKAAHEV